MPPDRWWLKTPAHMFSIDALDAVYPDARFVMTHRDVGKVLPSLCALYDTFSRVLTDRTDPVAIGAQNVAQWRTGLERLIDFRDRGNEGRFHDLSFEAVQHDPMAEMAALYADLGDELIAEARSRMRAWWTESARSRSGPRRYEAADLRPRPAEHRGPVRLLPRPLRRPRRTPQELDRRPLMSTIFVTGGTGLTGANVCEQLVTRGDGVRALVRNPEEAPALAAIGVDLVQGDITDAATSCGPPTGARPPSTVPRCSAGPARTSPTSRPST